MFCPVCVNSSRNTRGHGEREAISSIKKAKFSSIFQLSHRIRTNLTKSQDFYPFTMHFILPPRELKSKTVYSICNPTE